jgi:hypothetical protein
VTSDVTAIANPIGSVPAVAWPCRRDARGTSAAASGIGATGPAAASLRDTGRHAEAHKKGRVQ